MRIGVIFCGWGTRDLIEQSLTPWVNLRDLNSLAFQTDRVTPTISICAVSVRFAGFEGEDDGTREFLRGALERGDIDHLVDSPDNIPEVTARSMALNYLKEQGVTHTWMVDSDELYEINQINDIIAFVNSNPWCIFFRLSLRNYVFDDKTYLAEPFTPHRIHRIDSLSSCIAESFYEDNGIAYRGAITNELFPDRLFASMTVPEGVAAIKHISWPNNRRGKSKQEYQWKRWGDACSFSWDDTQGGLIFNPALPRPKVIHE